ncbi:MAG: hypothetical protein R6U55_14170, partial [Desulfovermiculus sp.]
IPDVKLIGISDIMENSLREIAQKYEIAVVEKDYHCLLDNKQINFQSSHNIIFNKRKMDIHFQLT